MRPHPAQYLDLLRTALQEDLGNGFDYSCLLFSDDQIDSYNFVCREHGVLAGGFLLIDIANLVDPRLKVTLFSEDGERIHPNDVIAKITGPITSILLAERTSLNFLCHLSGIATLTNRFVEKIAGTQARICDTRKTLPGLRNLQKYAVRAGGGFNHRFGLYDMVMLKDNHLSQLDSLELAITSLRAQLGHPVKIEVEADNLDQFREALRAGSDAVLLDNMSIEDLRTAVNEGKGKILLEASGGINLDNVREIALTGVDLISIGKLTHSAPSLDIGLDPITSSDSFRG